MSEAFVLTFGVIKSDARLCLLSEARRTSPAVTMALITLFDEECVSLFMS